MLGERSMELLGRRQEEARKGGEAGGRWEEKK